VEHTLALIAGAGVLPARMAARAQAQGWRVVAFAFAAAPGLERHADVVVPSRLAELGALLAGLREHAVSAAVFSGKFWMADLLGERSTDATLAGLARQAGSFTDANLVGVAATTLEGLGIRLLDQRPFLGDWIAEAGCWTSRAPTDGETGDIDRGLAAARALAEAGVGQTVVVRRGAVAAAEAIEGTTEAVRRGSALAGPGAVVVKATARAHDYRFDVPGVGPDTIAAAAAGGVAAVAVEAGRVLVLDRERTVADAEAAGLAFLAVGADGDAG
jgi:DUF1009 family protein